MEREYAQLAHQSHLGRHLLERIVREVEPLQGAEVYHVYREDAQLVIAQVCGGERTELSIGDGARQRCELVLRQIELTERFAPIQK